MKKYIFFYVIAMIIDLVLALTKGFSANIIIHSYNDKYIARCHGDVLLSIINCFIIAIILILNITVTLNKNNKIKIKWLFCFVTIMTALCVPIGIHSYSGGIAGIIDEDHMYLWNIVFYLDKGITILWRFL